MGQSEIQRSFYNDEKYWETYTYSVNPQEVRDTVREEYMDFNGTPIHLDIYDKGLPADAVTLVWCPGTAVFCRFYIEFLLRMWKRGYRVVCIDQIGHGKSGGLRGHFTMPLLVDVLKAAITYTIDKLGVTGKIVVGGSSLGGFTAFYTGAMDSRVSATMCHNILYGGLFKPTEMFRLNSILKIAMKLLPLFVKILPKFRMSVWNYLKVRELIDPSNARSVGLVDVLLADPTLSDKYSVAGLYSQMKWHPDTPLEQFKTPCMLLLGSNDAIFPLSMEQRLFDRLGAPKELALIEGGSHMVIAERAEECVTRIDAWLHKVL
jgi:pimeloyl-ACP methyl ester carboxylesterase